jgi:hypothetical protein
MDIRRRNMKRFLPILSAIQMLSCLAFCAFASGIDMGIPVSVTGELTILNVDDFDRGIGKTIYHLKDAHSNKVYQLRFAGEPPTRLRTGGIVTAKGRVKGEELLLADSEGVQLEGEPALSALYTLPIHEPKQGVKLGDTFG